MGLHPKLIIYSLFSKHLGCYHFFYVCYDKLAVYNLFHTSPCLFVGVFSRVHVVKIELLDHLLYAFSAVLDIANLFSKEDRPVNILTSNILERVHISLQLCKHLTSAYFKDIFIKLIV